MLKNKTKRAARHSENMYRKVGNVIATNNGVLLMVVRTYGTGAADQYGLVNLTAGTMNLNTFETLEELGSYAHELGDCLVKKTAVVGERRYYFDEEN